MANALSKSGRVWVCDSVGTLETGSTKIQKIVYMPSAADDDLIFQTDDSEVAFVLKAGATDASPVQLDFTGDERSIPGLKITTIDGGTAYVYLR